MNRPPIVNRKPPLAELVDKWLDYWLTPKPMCMDQLDGLLNVQRYSTDILEKLWKRNTTDYIQPWWRHDMETPYTLLILCQRNPQMVGGFSSQRLSNEELWCFNWFWTNIEQTNFRCFETLRISSGGAVMSDQGSSFVLFCCGLEPLGHWQWCNRDHMVTLVPMKQSLTWMTHIFVGKLG